MSGGQSYPHLAQRHPSVHTTLLECLDRMQPHPMHKHSRNTLNTIIKNIIQHPDDKKFTRIKIDVSKFKERIMDVPGGMDFLLEIGFVVHQSDKAKYLHWPSSGDFEYLELAECLIKPDAVRVKVFVTKADELETIGIVFIDIFSTILDLKEKIYQLMEHVTPENSIPPHEQSLFRLYFQSNSKTAEKTAIAETHSKQVSARQLGIVYNTRVEVVRKAVHVRLVSPALQMPNTFIANASPDTNSEKSVESSTVDTTSPSDLPFSPNDLQIQLKKEREGFEKRLEELEEKNRSKMKAAQDQIEKHKEIAKVLRKQVERLTGQAANQLQVPELLSLQQELIHSSSLVSMALQQRFDDFEEEVLCVICKETRKNTLFTPCSHLCVCLDCSHKVESECPICMQAIEGRQRVYAFDK